MIIRAISTTFLSLCLILMGFGFMPATQAAGAVNLVLSPSMVTTNPEGSFTLEVMAEAGSQTFDAVEIHLNFDPQSLEIIDSKGKPALTVQGSGVFDVELLNAVDNVAGQISYAVGNLTSMLSGSVKICSILFRAKLGAASSTKITFSQDATQKTDVVSSEVDPPSVLGQLSEATISITGNPSPTPTPSTTPSPTPSPTPSGSPTPTPSPTFTPPTFPDISNHWAQDSIIKLAGQGIVTGYPDGAFRPDSPVTRAELVTILVKAKKYKVLDLPSSFSDTQGHWASNFIETAVVNGLTMGYPDGTFHPDQPITRAEETAMMIRMLGLDEVKPETPSFSDVSSSFWAYGYIEQAKAQQIVTGYPDGTFLPDQRTTRAEACTMLVRALGL